MPRMTSADRIAARRSEISGTRTASAQAGILSMAHPFRAAARKARPGFAYLQREEALHRVSHGHDQPPPSVSWCAAARPPRRSRACPGCRSCRPSAGPARVSSVSDGRRSPMIWPSNITAMRSDSDRISSSSTETSRIALPSSRRRTICWWMNSIAPMSTPRVGWPTSRRSGLRSISRASTIFCWLPPEKFCARQRGVGRAHVETLHLVRGVGLDGGVVHQPALLDGAGRGDSRRRRSPRR